MNTITIEGKNDKSLSVDQSLLDNYFGLLKSLSRETKIQLTAKLTRNIADETDLHTNKIDRFCGAWKSEKTAEEIIAEIRADRTFNTLPYAL
jgi:hypothetical protein